jgi:hypothetical protein
MQWWPQIGDEPRQGKRQGQAAKPPDPHLGECNVYKDDATKGKAQKLKDEPAVVLCSINGIDGYA